MTDTRTERIVKIDAAIACHHNAHLAAIWVDHEDEAAYHSSEEDRLLDLRNRVERKAPA